MGIFPQSKYKTQTKVYVIFLLALGLPSLILGYLALRGIMNDRARAEQELLRKHEGIAVTLSRQIEAQFSQIENILQDLLLGDSAFTESVLRSASEHLKSAKPFVDLVFAVKQGTLVFPPAVMLYDPHEPLGLPDAAGGRRQPGRLLRTAEQLEFISGDFARANSVYQQAFAAASTDRERADLLLRIGRTARKAAMHRAAAEAFERLEQDYDQIIMPGGLPAGLVARLELAALLLEKPGGDTASSVLFATYRDLAGRKWSLSRSRFDFTTARVTELWSLADGSRNESDSAWGVAFDSMVQETGSRIALTEKLFKIGTDLYPIIRERLNRARSSEVPHLRISAGVGEKLQSVALAAAPAGRADGVEAIGALVSTEEMCSAYLPSLISSLPLPSNSSILLRDNQGVVIAGPSPPATAHRTLARPLAGNFPPWTVELYQQDPQLFEDLLQSRHSNYVYLLALLLGILAFGVFLTVRMMSREIKLAKLKSDFVSTVSHEFRSPLTSIRQLAEMLETGRVPTEERRQHYYQVIQEQSERLSHLVTNILDLDRIEDGFRQLEYETVDLPRLLKDIVAKMQQQTRHEGYLITLDVDHQLPAIRLDPNAITQVVGNLIDNAIKYSGDSQNVAVRAFMEGEYAVIAVEDQGVGIKKEEIKKIFDRFYRGGDELTRSVRGSGLGLALVQKLVRAHQGSVVVQSEPGRGTVFTVRLPVNTPEEKSRGKNSHR